MNITPFENLSTSTATVMVYSNLRYDLKKIFDHIPVYSMSPPLTKKKKNINKKELVSPYGRIISLQHSIYIRGIRMSKKKKYWCPTCQPIEICEDEEEKKILTVEEEVKPLAEDDEEFGTFPDDTQKIHFVCRDCKGEFKIKQLQKIVPFLNQVTIVLSIGTVIVNIMMFKDNFKLVGNKSIENAYEAIMILWENYITATPDGWAFRSVKSENADTATLATDSHFLFDLVMRNVDFNLGFSIDKKKLNMLMNLPEYKNQVHLSQCETTSATHVNIKMYTKQPDNFTYDMLVYDKGENHGAYFSKVSEKLYAKKKKPVPAYITFIVFSSAEIILTGRYFANMKERYEFFVKTAQKNRSDIEEIIDKPKISIRDYLSSINNNVGSKAIELRC